MIEDSERELRSQILLHEDEDDDEQGEDEPLMSQLPGIENAYTSRWHIVVGYLVFLCIGMAPQLAQNALFSETALFRERTPEKNEISAYIVTAFMLANVVIVIYLIIQYFNSVKYLFFGQKPQKRLFFNSQRDSFFIYVIMIGGIIDSILVIFFWNQTVRISSVETRWTITK